MENNHFFVKESKKDTIDMEWVLSLCVKKKKKIDEYLAVSATPAA